MEYLYPEAAEELKTLGYRLRALERLRERLCELDTAKYGISGSTSSSSPTPGGGSREEDKIGTLICKCYDTYDAYKNMLKLCAPVQAVLDVLPDDERRVLELCFVNRGYGWEIRAGMILHVSRARVYQIKVKALERYSDIRGILANGRQRVDKE